ncbi:D123-domain-containing protein [Podospora appendiculata]|uniref:D123-domain-containing protein n=1 Tax=Podospora appendiculata TaxID=314037 RepID=A0AAE1CFJ8_9PEZI|nr:D123-domain-containing protein [Podospora appendiculata]
MPALEAILSSHAGNSAHNGEDDPVRFPPVTRDHILHCSYDFWFPKYRTSCIRSRVIPLTPEFVSYIREDGILLADDEPGSGATDEDANDADDDDDWEPTAPSTHRPHSPSPDSESDSDSDAEPTPPKLPPNRRFPDLHKAITVAITALGGAAAPKLNWSSPKDATWISRHPNTVKCTSADDVYLLLKSSSFISHDLDHAFDDTTPTPTSSQSQQPAFTPVLVLRAFFNPLPSLEFRCFVKDRNLIAITQRDLNYYAFLHALRPAIVRRVRELFARRLRLTFPDACFVFDVYIPEAAYVHDSDNSDGDDDDGGASRLGRARLIDINPWAPRTDTLLFGWRELLDVRVARPILGAAVEVAEEGDVTTEDEDEDEEYEPEVRLVEHDDPAAYNFSSPQYSAHKLPKDVVDASLAGDGGMREFAARWQRMTEGGGVAGRSSGS